MINYWSEAHESRIYLYVLFVSHHRKSQVWYYYRIHKYFKKFATLVLNIQYFFILNIFQICAFLGKSITRKAHNSVNSTLKIWGSIYWTPFTWTFYAQKYINIQRKFILLVNDIHIIFFGRTLGWGIQCKYKLFGDLWSGSGFRWKTQRSSDDLKKHTPTS